MTTAHRPTYYNAHGSGDNPSGNKLVCTTRLISGKDLPQQLNLKLRQPGQGTKEELARKDFLAILAGSKAQENPFPEDADDADDDDKKSNHSKSDDEDDTEELMRELEKIKKERAAEEAEKQRLEEEEQEKKNRDNILKGNALLNSGDFSLKRKWDDDCVFKNQQKNAPKEQKRFVNDAVRSDFHRKFLNKYIHHWLKLLLGRGEGSRKSKKRASNNNFYDGTEYT